MTARAARLAVALSAAAAAVPALGQWESRPIVVWLEGAGRDAVPGTFGGDVAGQDDLLVVDQAGATASLRPHHAPLTVRPSPFPAASLPLDRAFRAGYLGPNGADARADVASHYATGGLGLPPSRIDVVFGHEPGTVRAFTLPEPTDRDGPSSGGPPHVASFLRLLARSPRADTLVLPYCLDSTCSRLFLVDPVTAGSAAIASVAGPDLDPMDSQQPEAFPVWLSATARANGVDDVAVSSFGTVVLWTHGEAPAAASLDGLELSDPVVVGTTRHTLVARPAWLPATVGLGTLTGFNEVHGAASLDVDLDGIPDVVLAMSYPRATSMPGSLIWVKGTGSLRDFADPARSPWHDLGAQLGLPDPVVVRPLRATASRPASIAVWDRTLRELVVVTPAPAEGRLAVWRAPAPGTWARALGLADVVGGAEPDLVAVVDGGPQQPTSVLIFPDPGGPWPTLAWAPGSPGVALRGVDHPISVVLEPGGASSVTVEWVIGAAAGAPVATGLSLVIPATCAPSPAPVAVTARAITETGTMSPDLAGTVAFTSLAPALSMSGASAGLLALPPGGTSAVFEATVVTACGAARFSGTPWPPGATVADAAGPTSLRRTVALPEATYPALLAEAARVVAVETSDPGVVPSTASLAVALDASGLVELSEEADRTSLDVGELAMLRLTLRSRIGVAIPLVSVSLALTGLEPAGAPAVRGAELVSGGGGEGGLVLSALPPAGGEVVVELPVRALAGRGGASATARSSGGWSLTAAPPPAGLGSRTSPGCGCGGGAGPGIAGLALAALALRRRPRRAT